MTDEIIEDGFGNGWEKCGRDDCDLQVVRPGSAQCNGTCGDIIDRLCEQTQLAKHGYGDHVIASELMQEAADEIKHLRSGNLRLMRLFYRESIENDDTRSDLEELQAREQEITEWLVDTLGHPFNPTTNSPIPASWRKTIEDAWAQRDPNELSQHVVATVAEEDGWITAERES